VIRILIIGGYGVFGERIATQLARDAGLEIIIAGRSREKAERLACTLRETTAARISAATLDTATVTATDLATLAPEVVINASGPFQNQNYALAAQSIRYRCHYIDLADGRAFVSGITSLDASALDAGVSVISGASSVPALSSAVVRNFEDKFASIEKIEIAISPGSGFEPGEATVAAGLSYLGKPIAVRMQGRATTVYGWQGLEKRTFGNLGRRWTAYCDVPDLDLFPAHYPGLKSMSFRAGLEVGLMTLGLWTLSWPARAGLPWRPEALAPFVSPLRKPLAALGRNCGAMRVEIHGRDQARQPIAIQWVLTAGDGDGLNVPALASIILARKLARGTALPRGAMACFGLVSLAEFEAEFARFKITTSAHQTGTV
jgi:NAD(P)-dependent dehydrogenase (short-subunit alcohol dehydrogenase family)